jgi:hypothetical protein
VDVFLCMTCLDIQTMICFMLNVSKYGLTSDLHNSPTLHKPLQNKHAKGLNPKISSLTESLAKCAKRGIELPICRLSQSGTP